jgi:hypothetical protein
MSIGGFVYVDPSTGSAIGSGIALAVFTGIYFFESTPSLGYAGFPNPNVPPTGTDPNIPGNPLYPGTPAEWAAGVKASLIQVRLDYARMANGIAGITPFLPGNIPAGSTGNLLVYNGTNWVPLANGASGTVLTATPTGLPTWTAPASSGGGGIAPPGTPLNGDLVYYVNGQWTRLDSGPSGTVLTSVPYVTPLANLPTWQLPLLPYVVQTSGDPAFTGNVVPWYRYMIDASVSAFTLNIPNNPPAYSQFSVVNSFGSFAVNNCIVSNPWITPYGIEDPAHPGTFSSFVTLHLAGTSVEWIYDPTTSPPQWKILTMFP